MKRFFARLAENSYLMRFLAWLLVHNFVDLLVIVLPIRLRAADRRRVIFTRLDSIGDYLIWTSAFDLIETVFPSTHFERILVGNEVWNEFAERSATFDQKLFLNRKLLATDPIYRFRVLRQVRALGANVIINPTLSRDFLWSDSVVRCVAASERVGSGGIANRMVRFQQWICDSWYTRLLSPPADQHEALSNDEFVRALSACRLPSRKIPPPRIEAREKIDTGLPSSYAVIFVGAQFGYKRWPVERFAEVAAFVKDKLGLGIVIAGGPGEEHLATEFSNYFHREFDNLIGRTSLSQLTSIVAGSELIVSNDTSVCHIAAGFGRPTVVINSGAHVGRFFPYASEQMEVSMPHASVIHEMPCFGCDWNCVYKKLSRDDPKPCITGITVEQVIHAIKNLMGNHGRPPLNDSRSTVISEPMGR